MCIFVIFFFLVGWFWVCCLVVLVVVCLWFGVLFFFFFSFCFSRFESMNSFFPVLKRGQSWSLLPLNSVLECTFES